MTTRVQRALAGCFAGLMLCGTTAAMPADNTALGNVLTPSITQAKTYSPTSTVKNGQFCMSYTDLVDNLNTAFGSDALSEYANLKAIVNKNGSNLRIEIKAGTKTVGYGLLYDENDDKLSPSDASKGFNDFTLFFPMTDSNEEATYVTLAQYASVWATDPSISSSKVSAIVGKATDSVETLSSSSTNPVMGGGVRYNGVEYQLFLMDDTWMITVQVE